MKTKIVLASLVSMTLLQAMDVNVTQMSVKQEGATYIKILGGELKKELQSQIKKDPTGLEALAFCTGSAMRITQEVNAKLPAYAKVRRTTLQTRNAHNAPDAIDTKVMKDYMVKMNTKTFTPNTITVIVDGNVTRIYKPLVTEPSCLKCHGETLSKEIQATISSSYPNDKAVGFKEGSLRGVVVAEIKKSH